jgi:hypothetical protein
VSLVLENVSFNYCENLAKIFSLKRISPFVIIPKRIFASTLTPPPDVFCNCFIFRQKQKSVFAKIEIFVFLSIFRFLKNLFCVSQAFIAKTLFSSQFYCRFGRGHLAWHYYIKKTLQIFDTSIYIYKTNDFLLTLLFSVPVKRASVSKERDSQ